MTLTICQAPGLGEERGHDVGAGVNQKGLEPLTISQALTVPQPYYQDFLSPPSLPPLPPLPSLPSFLSEAQRLRKFKQLS